MLTLKTLKVVDSLKFPGVRYHVRTLSVIQRARRDASIAQQRLEWLRLSNEQDTLRRKLLGDHTTEFVSALRQAIAKLELADDHPVTLGLARFATQEEMADKFDRLPEDEKAKLEAVQQEHTLLYQQHILPATIRAALVKVEGLELEGGEATVENILEHAPDELLAEVYDACAGASGLVEESQKN